MLERKKEVMDTLIGFVESELTRRRRSDEDGRFRVAISPFREPRGWICRFQKDQNIRDQLRRLPFVIRQAAYTGFRACLAYWNTEEHFDLVTRAVVRYLRKQGYRKAANYLKRNPF
eukprot:gb/GECG01004513.1/.p1 GENE.gb/GECG01004513.1/~~gb/GECG01004513.1/.p1  ORF type:complete len:116 (+),score=13.18 gb/GECG01004513.1/:1-348(+)